MKMILQLQLHFYSLKDETFSLFFLLFLSRWLHMNPDGGIEDLVNFVSRQRRTFNVSRSPNFVRQGFSLK